MLVGGVVGKFNPEVVPSNCSKEAVMQGEWTHVGGHLRTTGVMWFALRGVTWGDRLDKAEAEAQNAAITFCGW